MNHEIGTRFGRLVVLGPGKEKRYLLCRCDCGTEKEIREDHLRHGATKSCGCYRREFSRKQMLKIMVRTHGMSKTPEYHIWLNLRYRCNTPSSDAYDMYGGRGIQVCQRYDESFEAFYEDLGPRPSDSHSIDRTDNDGHYSCGKCNQCLENGWGTNLRWATPTQQTRNSRWVKDSVAQMAREVGLNPNTVRGRVFRGWSLKRALNTPVMT